GARETRRTGSLRRLLPNTRPYRFHFIAAAFFSLGVLTAQVAQPEVVRRFIDEVLEAKMRERLLPYALASLGLGLAWTSFAFTRRHISGRIALGLEYDLRNRLYAHLQNLSVDFHDGWQSGELVSRAVSDISRIRRYIGFGLVFLFQMGMQIALVIFQLIRIDAGLTLVAVAFSSPVVLVSYRFSRLYHQISRQSQDEQGDLTTIVEESATGVRVIKAFGRMPERSALYRKHAQKLYRTNLRGVDARKRLWTLDILLLGLSVVGILLFGGIRVIDGALTIGDLSAFVLYQQMLVWPIRETGWIIAMGQEASAGSDRVFELLDTPPDIADAPGAVSLATCRGEVRFEDVWFKYPGSEAWILRGIDFEIYPDETVALVGITGCGKTTIAALLSRFYDPTSGRVTLDGKDLQEITVESLRSYSTVAFEDPILFSVSIRENVLMGKPDGTDDEVWKALADAQADEFVRELPWGLDTRVGEQGYSLSGGQRQRVALARAVIGTPRILVLDNPLSSVDVHTEAKIEAALHETLVRSTALLIAHRPSTLLLADRVVLLHEGRVRATGTHHDLLASDELYRHVLAADNEGPERELEEVRT
ncbi:MAG: ABC transporter ATP-binding protein, partial [Actinomycetota bacterium]